MKSTASTWMIRSTARRWSRAAFSMWRQRRSCMRLGGSSLSMVAQAQDLWKLVWGKPQIDPNDLAAAVQDQAQRDDLDYRTRLLIRDSVDALKKHWGDRQVDEWMTRSPVKNRIQSICREEF